MVLFLFPTFQQDQQKEKFDLLLLMYVDIYESFDTYENIPHKEQVHDVSTIANSKQIHQSIQYMDAYGMTPSRCCKASHLL